ncbi:hypothetical protein LCGC14_0353030 [marine sediment metagenome]|uniref:Uncharacterized protein n=1 Tax=marine sediment metagenome TaxID=412755 RepID=A0A0F9TTB2_9ZZZZ
MGIRRSKLFAGCSSVNNRRHFTILAVDGLCDRDYKVPAAAIRRSIVFVVPLGCQPSRSWMCRVSKANGMVAFCHWSFRPAHRAMAAKRVAGARKIMGDRPKPCRMARTISAGVTGPSSATRKVSPMAAGDPKHSSSASARWLTANRLRALPRPSKGNGNGNRASRISFVMLPRAPLP